LAVLRVLYGPASRIAREGVAKPLVFWLCFTDWLLLLVWRLFPGTEIPDHDCTKDRHFQVVHRPQGLKTLIHLNPIANGVVEGACRHVKDHLERTGMGWTVRCQRIRTGPVFPGWIPW
jgi:hypothetical protein